MRLALVVVLVLSLARLAPAAEKELTVTVSPTVTLHGRVVGEGKTAWILLHGGPGLTSAYIVGLERLAAPGRRLVFYDQRGVGASSAGPDDGKDLAAHVGDLEAVRVAIGADKVVLVGHSWGGLLAMAYTGAHPDRVAGLILIDSAAPTITGMRAAQDRFSAHVEALQEKKVIGERVPPSGEDCSASVNVILPAYFADPARATVKVPPGGCKAGVTGETIRALGDYDVRPPLKALKVPVLVIAGAEDPFGKEVADEVAASFPAARVTRASLADCGHLPWLECPEGFEAALKRW